MTVKNGLYSIRIEMKNGGRGRATGVIVILDGKILGGDTHFYYTGSYTFKNGKWRGELGRVLINASEPDVRFQGTIR